MALFLDTIKESFLRQPKLCDLFDAVSNGNVRELLGYLIRCIRSGHLNTEKILEKIEEEDGYLMPVHEALRALLYQDYWHYDPETSAFVNLFDIGRADPTEHFTRLLTLSHLTNVSPSHPNYGYMARNQIEQHLFQLGYSAQHIESTLQFLFEKEYIEAKIPSDAWCPDTDLLRVTSRGMYSSTSLVRSFNYVDAVVVDTPITLESYRKRIWDVRPIRERLKRGTTFLEYLNECSQSLQDGSAMELWKGISNSIYTEIAQIEGRIS